MSEPTPEQNAFNIVYVHLLTQKKRAWGEVSPPRAGHKNEGCLYRAPDGTKCAIGALITDEEYSPEMEGERVGGTTLRPILERLQLDSEFAEELQEIHDSEDPEEWEGCLRVFAKSYKLTIPEMPS
jgi:hypothetical protein